METFGTGSSVLVLEVNSGSGTVVSGVFIVTAADVLQPMAMFSASELS